MLLVILEAFASGDSRAKVSGGLVLHSGSLADEVGTVKLHRDTGSASIWFHT